MGCGSACWSKNRAQVVTGSYDCTAKAWDASRGIGKRKREIERVTRDWLRIDVYHPHNSL